MIKNQELAMQIFEIMNTGVEALHELISLLKKEKMDDFWEVADGLLRMLENVDGIAEELYCQEDGMNLPKASKSVLVSLHRVCVLAMKDIVQASHKIEFELLPLIEEMRVNFFYWGMVYPDEERKRKYYEEDIYWLTENRYQLAAEETGHYKYDLSIIVTAYNKLEYTKQCVASLMKNLPKDCTYELIFVNHGSTDGTKEFFEEIHPHKQLDIAVNGGGLGAVRRITEGKYVVSISNDVLVSSNAIDNLYKCINSDEKIAWVVPSTPNVSNLQTISANYSSLEELEEFTVKNNISNPKRWEQRVRLCNPIDIQRESFRNKVKASYYYQSKQHFSFPDDRFALLCRRNGYKMYLAKDTYCHHFGSVTLREDKKTNSEEAFLQGRRDFAEMFGIDPWMSGMCFSPNLFRELHCEKEGKVLILGINCGLGSNPLKIKEVLKENSLTEDVYIKNIINDMTLYEDVMGVSDEICYMGDYRAISDSEEEYDYILAENIEYHSVIDELMLLLKKSKQKGVVIACLQEAEYKTVMESNSLQDVCSDIKFVRENKENAWVIIYK